MNKLKSLTWHYFWEQKLEEINDYFLNPIFQIGFWGLISGIILYGFSYFGRWIDITFFSDNLSFEVMETLGEHVTYGLLGLLFLILMILVVYMIIYYAMEWIFSNWERAKQRAKLDLKRVKNVNKTRVSKV